MHDTDATTITSRAAEQRRGGGVAEPVDLVVDRRVLLDVGVARRRCRPRAGSSRSRRRSTRRGCRGKNSRNSLASWAASDLFGREHQGGPLHLLDGPGDGGALPRAGDAEQRLEAVAARRCPRPAARWPWAGRPPAEVGADLEGAHRRRLLGGNDKHVSTKYQVSEYLERSERPDLPRLPRRRCCR